MIFELVMLYYVAGQVYINKVEYPTIEQCAEAAVIWDKNFPDGDNFGIREAQCIPKMEARKQ